MLTATESFLEPVEQWLKAIRENDFVSARRHAKSLVLAGELLTVHPDFLRCFKQNDGTDPKEALFHMCHFLLCATDGRAVVLKNWVQDNKPG